MALLPLATLYHGRCTRDNHEDEEGRFGGVDRLHFRRKSWLVLLLDLVVLKTISKVFCRCQNLSVVESWPGAKIQRVEGLAGEKERGDYGWSIPLWRCPTFPSHARRAELCVSPCGIGIQLLCAFLSSKL